jgi:ankyrin repeat protein
MEAKTQLNRRTLCLVTVTLLFALGVGAVRANRQSDLNHALLTAVLQHDTEAALHAIASGANPDVQAGGSYRRSSLRDLLDWLLGRSERKARGPTVLLLASKAGDAKVVRALLDHRVRQVNQTDTEGKSALSYEAEHGCTDNVRKLIERGASADGSPSAETSPLIAAVIGSGNPDVVDALLAAGAKAERQVNFDGSTALIYAAERANLKAVRILLAHGADVNACGGYSGTPLIAVVSAIGRQGKVSREERNRRHEIVRLLLASGADPNRTQRHGNAALNYAAGCSDHELIDTLLKAGASPNTGLRYGTPLMDAAAQGDLWTVKRLISGGAKINQTPEKWEETALIVAANQGHTDVVSFLLAKGADPNIRSGHGERALEAASKAGHPETVRVLRNVEWAKPHIVNAAP